MTEMNSPEMLQYLNTLLKQGNYTKAAKELYISQPYLTQVIKRVEKNLGIAIINRQSSPLQLTEAGREYYRYLSSLENEQDVFRKRIAKYSSTEQTVIRIGILSSLGTYLLPLFLPEYLKEYPQVHIELHEEFPHYNEQKALNGELDFFIGQNPEALSPNLTIYSRGKHRYFAIIPESASVYQEGEYFLNPQSISLKKLLQEKLVLTTHGSAIRRQVDYLVKKLNIQPDIILESNNIFTVAELAKENLGVTFVPESVPLGETNNRFNIYPMPLDFISLDYFIAHSANKTLNSDEEKLIAAFMDHLQFNLHEDELDQ
ncbi:LysR family transcriptional regulator [Jeotgalibaca ciconiae]|uniref:LysR family transcriptional regulator n=1 Tax=Jeotgalibaca ciconiae TaxID=2496265 RepID=A0A3Q9BL81_9LACT|nr:LysR family transcriptional regulator [Jeotgalibaca ciconiae]AZP04818.1 LysR family transcriptional regulator [Jeotgalibaca ciconiae]